MDTAYDLEETKWLFVHTSDEHHSSKYWAWLRKDVPSILIPTKEFHFVLQKARLDVG
jgi:hypothetical protein